ncbi:MAG: heparinase [Bacteroides clarus]|uniref:heparin-sulfate lyase HepC n=1 Tax=Bacteroides clarus TaxID=626929 RepID=UPI00241EF1D1|nr:heparin-sulfate lyase HepC [Bacteroides clarus]MBD9144516.1 heparinase [Bacteroides clarus]
MRHVILFLICMFACSLQAQSINEEAFSLLNLNYPGLEKVKELYEQGKKEAAAQALLKYYRNRTGVVNPAIDLNNITINKREQQWADEALEHTFYVHDGYQPAFNYGKDINWKYWLVKDNELRWQLHRHKWFTPMGKAYRISGDEKYAKEWTFQYLDWIKKNPLTQVDKEEYELASTGEVRGNAENARFAWRPLETSHRLQDQINQLTLFINSPSFTPAFLTEFLVNYHRHAVHILGNYSDQGNHLLFEAQRMLAAGAFFPEFKEASAWRKSGIDILNREIKVQVYPDGGQFELDLHYHLACIEIFCKALRMADVNGFRNEFPSHYVNTIESMIMFYMNVCYPDYTNPCFSDAKKGNPQTEQANYKEWLKLFPENKQILYFATNGQEGEAPANLSKGFLKSGFFTFRNGWKKDAMVMVVKAGPKGEWHCQPDNGTFELWFNGKNLFPDSGSYIYAGGPEVMKLRNWFRQTAVHNTLTLDNKNLETTESVTKLWKPEGNVQILVTENPSYKELKHRRSVFFVNQQYFVIVDEAIGNATGNINLHYQLCDGDIDIDAKTFSLSSNFAGENQVKLQCFAPKKTTLKEEEGWYSVAYRQRTERTAVSFNTEKKEKENVQFITVIYPTKSTKGFPKIEAKIKSNSSDTMEVEVSLNGKKQTLNYQLQ